MKNFIVFIIVVFVSQFVWSQKNDAIIVTINNEKIKVSDFKRVFEKNLDLVDKEGKDVAKSLQLFIDFKLKVKEAYELQLDTLKSYKREIETYKNQLTAPYLQDREFLNKLIKEAYERTKYEVRASHILIGVGRNASSKDTLAAYNQIMELRDSILKGADFSDLAKRFSKDPSVKNNAGDLGYFSAFKMVFEFEEAAYNTKVGKVSMPFRTRFGYHIVKTTDKRLSKGMIQVAHIFVRDTSLVGKTRIDSVYTKLLNGEDYATLAKQYSDDSHTKNAKGVLRPFGAGMMVKPFEDAAFLLDSIGAYTKPVKTRFGYHIIQLVKKMPVQPFNLMKKEVADKVKRSGRARLSDKVVLDRLKKKYSISEVKTSKWIFKRKDIRALAKDSLQDVLLKINEREIKQEVFVTYIFNRRHLTITQLFEQFKNAEILNYYKDNLEYTEPKYAVILKEYKDGLLLFEILRRKVWKPSQDSLAIKSYFEKHKTSYKETELEKVKGEVINDLQVKIERDWVAILRKKNTIKINKGVLKKLIKQYKKH